MGLPETASGPRWRDLAIAVAIAAGGHAVAWTLPRWTWPLPPALDGISWRYWVDLWTLLFGVALVLPAPGRSGLLLGRLREHGRGVLVVCGVPIVLTAAVYPLLPTRPWSGDSSSMWTVSPAAQDLVFFGCIYRVLGESCRGRVLAAVPVERTLFWTALVFTAWHIPNFAALPAGYVAFQLLYVFVGACVVGLARQWTGSLLYGWITHTAVNAIAWWTP
jgi:hypothetical protein